MGRAVIFGSNVALMLEKLVRCPTFLYLTGNCRSYAYGNHRFAAFVAATALRKT